MTLPSKRKYLLRPRRLRTCFLTADDTDGDAVGVCESNLFTPAVGANLFDGGSARDLGGLFQFGSGFNDPGAAFPVGFVTLFGDLHKGIGTIFGYTSAAPCERKGCNRTATEIYHLSRDLMGDSQAKVFAELFGLVL